MNQDSKKSDDSALRIAILHYFRSLTPKKPNAAAAALAAAAAVAAPEKIQHDSSDKENAEKQDKGERLVTLLLEEFPELEKYKNTPQPPIPALKVRFEAYPDHLNRLMFLEKRTKFLEESLRNLVAATTAAVKKAPSKKRAKRKDPPKNSSTETTKKPKTKKAKASPETGKDGKKSKSNGQDNPQKGSSQHPATAASSKGEKPSPFKEGVPWEERYQQLVHYQKGYGHCRVPGLYKGVHGLGYWVRRQRILFKEKKLSAENIEKLDALKFDWVLREGPSKTWDDRFEELKVFQSEHGHTNVPRSHPSNLGEWVHSQRSLYREKRPALMKSDRCAKLQAIGFDFQPMRGRKSWDAWFEQLLNFRRRHGNLNVPLPDKGPKTNKTQNDDNNDESASADTQQNDEDKHFFIWFEKQRQAYWKCKRGEPSDLTRARFKKLDDIGFGTETDEYILAGPRRGLPAGLSGSDLWNLRFDQLVSYKTQHGHCNVQTTDANHSQLASWVKTQRREYRALNAMERSSMTQARRQKLEELGFEWTLRPWMLKENRQKELEEDHNVEANHHSV